MFWIKSLKEKSITTYILSSYALIRVKGVEPSLPKKLEPKSKQHPLYHRLKTVKMDLWVIDSHRSP